MQAIPLNTSWSDRINAFSTRYQGSKRKLLPWLRATFDELEFDTALDLMSGSASVSYLLKQLGKTVLSNDCLRFNYVTARAIIENSQDIVDEQDIHWILSKHNEIRYSDFIARTFENFYFTPEENEWIDITIANINCLTSRTAHSTEAKKAIATHALVQSCLMKRPFNLFHRRNLNLRHANVPRTFGNHATWETPFETLLRRNVAQSNSLVFCNGKQNKAINEDAQTLAERSVDLVYIDPPYFRVGGHRERSNYRLAYHFAEGLAQYDVWPSLVDFESQLRSLKTNGDSCEILYQCDPSELHEAFVFWLSRIIENWPNSKVVLSYNHPGIPDVASIRRLLLDTGREVDIKQTEYRYVLKKRTDESDENFELLFIAT